MKAIDFVISSFRADLVRYSKTYKAVYGYAPRGKALEKIILSSLDQISDASIRAKLRRGLKCTVIDMSTDSPSVRLGVTVPTIKWLTQYLADGR